MTPRQRRTLDEEVRACTFHEQRQLAAGIDLALSVAADVGLDMGEAADILAAVRGLIESRIVRPRPRGRYRRYADHE